MKFSDFPLVNVGTIGRRALALFLDDGVAVTATDAVAAECAMQAVLEAMRVLGLGPDADRYASWLLDLTHSFPGAPDDACTEHEHTYGAVDGGWFENLVAFGYVMPSVQGHQLGGSVLDRATGRPRLFGPHGVRLISGSRTQ